VGLVIWWLWIVVRFSRCQNSRGVSGLLLLLFVVGELLIVLFLFGHLVVDLLLLLLGGGNRVESGMLLSEVADSQIYSHTAIERKSMRS
jgi:hypothetical protein